MKPQKIKIYWFNKPDDWKPIQITINELFRRVKNVSNPIQD
jgi:hypothetical protein